MTPEVLVCEIGPERYRFVFSPVFFGTPGSSGTRALTLWREPESWAPAFTAWGDLARWFAPLTRVLRTSPDVTLVLKTYFRLDSTPEPIGGERSWFSFVTRIVAIGRERLLALVDPEMHTLVCHILEHLEQFRADYETTPADNHRPNVPPEWHPRIVDMVSLKSTHARGNFQLTLTRLRDPEECLLDADIDESGELLRHLAGSVHTQGGRRHASARHPRDSGASGWTVRGLRPRMPPRLMPLTRLSRRAFGTSVLGTGVAGLVASAYVSARQGTRPAANGTRLNAQAPPSAGWKASWASGRGM